MAGGFGKWFNYGYISFLKKTIGDPQHDFLCFFFSSCFFCCFFLFCSSDVPVVVGEDPRPTKNWTHITIMGS